MDEKLQWEYFQIDRRSSRNKELKAAVWKRTQINLQKQKLKNNVPAVSGKKEILTILSRLNALIPYSQLLPPAQIIIAPG